MLQEYTLDMMSHVIIVNDIPQIIEYTFFLLLYLFYADTYTHTKMNSSINII